MGAIREFVDRLLSGAASTKDAHPFTTLLGLEEYAPGLAFVSSFANVVVVDTADGLLLFDTSSQLTGATVLGQIREWSARPIHSIVFTHGHIDHVMGVRAFEQMEPAVATARVIAHEAIGARFERYLRSAGYNGVINARQFGFPGFVWPTDYRRPDVLYRNELELELGGVKIELRHARGETDDHTWAWLPAQRAVVTGDLFIWASPNCGNPQKVQRYPNEWAAALRAMAALGPVLLLPGHGPPIEGAERVHQALSDSAELLEHLHDRTLELMNEGAPLDVILGRVRAPEHLLERPWLRPVYDEPEFIVRNVWRLYGGWWDGNPANLKPAREEHLAAEIARASGGALELARRADVLSRQGEHALACHLVEWAGRAAPGDAEIRALRAAVYQRRAESETSLMAKGIYRAAAED